MSFMAMPVLAALAGALAGIYLGSLAIEWAITRRLFDSPDFGIPAATFAAAAAMFGLYWFGVADNGAFTPLQAGLAYAGVAIVVTAARIVALRRRRPDGDRDRGAEVGDVFR